MYQVKNVCTVLCAVDVLRKQGYNISETSLHCALENVKPLTGMRGRWDIVQNHPTIIQDVAHNIDGVKQVLFQLASNYPKAQLHFVLGFVKDKDVAPVLELFPKDAFFLFYQFPYSPGVTLCRIKKYGSPKGFDRRWLR